MATLKERLDSLATAIGNHIRDAVVPRLLPPGGTAGQALIKGTGTDYDVSWGAVGGGGLSTPTPVAAVPQAAGTYFSASIGAVSTGTIAQAANRLEFYPFIPARDISIDELALDVSTGVASSLARAGIYSDNNGQPSALLRGTADLNCATTGAKAEAVSALALTKGTTYWLAVLASSTQTLRGIPVSALLPLGLNASGGTYLTTRRATATYASGLPGTAPATTLNNAIAPLVRMRVPA